MEVLGEPPDRTDVGKCGSLRVITALEFLEHPFAKLGHRDLLVTQTYLLAASDASPCHHAQRPPRERLSSNGDSGKVATTCPAASVTLAGFDSIQFVAEGRRVSAACAL